MMLVSRFWYTVSTAAVVVSVLMLSAPAPAMASFPGRNGSVAFTRTAGGSTDIWTVDPYSGLETMLVKKAHSPVWSPDGTRLAFVNDQGLGIIRANGSGQQMLTLNLRAVDSSPVWAPDGSRIAFVREKRDGSSRSAIFAVSPNGSQEVNISGWPRGSMKFRVPSWSPDKQLMVYEQYDKHTSSLVIQNVRTHHTRQLTALSDVTSSSRVAWSPNGSKVLFTDSEQAVYTIWPDGTHRTVISDGESYFAAWSPTGEKIVFLEDINAENISISEKDGTIVWMPLEKGAYQAVGPPLWSPDGTKILFTMTRQGVLGEAVTDLFFIDTQTTIQTPKPLAHDASGELNWQARQ